MSKITLVEQATDPSAPAANQIVVYAKTVDDGLYWMDDAGSVHQVGGVAALAAGTQTALSGTVVLSNSNGVTFGMSGSTRVTASVDAVRAISAGTASASGSNVVFSNSNGISFGVNGQTVTAQMPSVSMFVFPDKLDGPQANSAMTNSTVSNVSFQRLCVPFQISATNLEYLAHLTVAGSTAGSTTMSVAVYTLTGSTANSASSTTAGVTFNSGGANSTAASVYSGQSGTRWRSVPLGTWNLTPGEYIFGFIHSANGPAGTTGSVTIYGRSLVAVQPGPGVAVKSNYWADGLYSAATGAFPATMHLSDINQTASLANQHPFFRVIGTF